MPMLCPPPRTRDTVGFDKVDIISARASPASTSPPTVFKTTKRPLSLGFSSTAISWGIRCSYFVALLSGGRTLCPSMLPIIFIY